MWFLKFIGLLLIFFILVLFLRRLLVHFLLIWSGLWMRNFQEGLIFNLIFLLILWRLLSYLLFLHARFLIFINLFAYYLLVLVFWTFCWVFFLYTFSIFLPIASFSFFFILLIFIFTFFAFLTHTMTLFSILASTVNSLHIAINLIAINKHFANNLRFRNIICIFLQSRDLDLTLFLVIIFIILLVFSHLLIQFSNMRV